MPSRVKFTRKIEPIEKFLDRVKNTDYAEKHEKKFSKKAVKELAFPTLVDANKAGMSLKQLEHCKHVPLDKQIAYLRDNIVNHNKILKDLHIQLSELTLAKMAPLVKKWEGKCFRKLVAGGSKSYYKYIFIGEVNHVGATVNIIIDAPRINDIKFCLAVDYQWCQFKDLRLTVKNEIDRRQYNSFLDQLFFRMKNNFGLV